MNCTKLFFNDYQRAFLDLVKAGLWEKEVQLLQYRDIDFSVIMQLAEEQSVVGLVTAGMEHVVDVKVPQVDLLQFIGSTLQIEEQNKSMNKYISELVGMLRSSDVYTLLVKGQGVAQCYEKPLWRSSGDVDLLLSDNNYRKAKKILVPMAVDVEREFKSLKHLGMTMPEGFVVELHGTLHSHLSRRVDKVIDSAQNDIFYGGNVRSWTNGDTMVFLPSPDGDVIFIFTHILQHFYFEGIGLRQVCDWCRLLWTYRDSLNHGLLEKRLRKAGLMSEWKAFAAFVVDYLGMPVGAMPLYDSSEKWHKKAKRIGVFIMEMGNFGHNNARTTSNSYFGSKAISLWQKGKVFRHHLSIFPFDSVKFFLYSSGIGMRNLIKGE